MHSTMMHLTTLALLVVILSVQVLVHAGPISIPAAVHERRGDKDTGILFARAEGTTAGKQEQGTAGTSPEKCPAVCSDNYDPCCATNSNRQLKHFENKCRLDLWNCNHPNDKYGNEEECTDE